MNKADDKQLEEAIKKVEIMIKGLKEYGIMHATTDEDAEAIETILKELERLQEENKNSIPKDKIREKIEELEKEQVKVKNNKLIYSREDVFRFQIYILEELLEMK